MKLELCAFTGADDAVNPADLAALSVEYPFAEWSILWEPEGQGTARTPKAEWIKRFSETCKDTHTCLHLCASALPDFVAGEAVLLDLMKSFKRIQFNFEYLDAGAKVDPAKLAARAKESPQWEFILQYGEKFAHYLTAFDGVPNHALLFDGSAGQGVNPDKWPAPLTGRKCGYAGGLNPANMEANLKAISSVVPQGYATWVDQESGARTDDVFDLAKVRKVLEIAAPYAAAA